MSDTAQSPAEVGRLGPIDRPGLYTWSVSSESQLSSINALPDGSPLTSADVGRVAKAEAEGTYHDLTSIDPVSWNQIGGSSSSDSGSDGGSSGASLPVGLIQGFATKFSQIDFQNCKATVAPGFVVTTEGLISFTSETETDTFQPSSNQYIYAFKSISGFPQMEVSNTPPAFTSDVPYPHRPDATRKRLVAAYFQQYYGEGVGNFMDSDGWLTLTKPITTTSEVSGESMSIYSMPPVEAAKKIRAKVTRIEDSETDNPGGANLGLAGYNFVVGDVMQIEIALNPTDGSIPIEYFGVPTTMRVEVAQIQVDRYGTTAP